MTIPQGLHIFKASIEKSDRTVQTGAASRCLSALQRSQCDQDYIDSKQVGNEEQKSVMPEQTSDSNQSPGHGLQKHSVVSGPKPLHKMSQSEEEGYNPNADGDKSGSSKQLQEANNQENNKKSFQYGIEDVKNDSSQILNLNITKHEDSVREAPLSMCNSIKGHQFEPEFNMVSEIRGGKSGEYEKQGCDNSLTEVMKVFRDNDKKNSKSNFGWNKAVQHTTIRLNEINQEADRIDRKTSLHRRSASKNSVRSSLNRNKLQFDYAKFGLQSSQNFTERMQMFQQTQFGNRASSKKSPRGISPGGGMYHSKQPSLASSHAFGKSVLGKTNAPFDTFFANKNQRRMGLGLQTERNGHLRISRNGIMRQSQRSGAACTFDMQSQKSSYLGSRKRPTNVKGVMKTQIDLMSSLSKLAPQKSLYSHVIHAKKKSKDINLKRLQESLNGRAVGNPLYKEMVEKKKELPFELGTGPQDHLVCQGKLLRYKPGIEKDFVQRWVQMTRQDFRYFENSMKAEGCLKAERLVLMAKYSGHEAIHTAQNIQCGNSVPLVSIPTSAILKAVRLRPEDFDIPNNRNKMSQQELYKNMFEIKLNCDFDTLRQYRDEIKANIDTISRCSPLRSNKHNQSKSNLSKRTPSVASFYGSPIPKKKNMFIKKFSKSPNLVNEQIGQQSTFKRAMAKHKKSHSRQMEDLNDLNTAVVNKVRIKLNKTNKRKKSKIQVNSAQKAVSPSKMTVGQSSLENEKGLPPKMKRESFYRSKSQVQLVTDSQRHQNLIDQSPQQLRAEQQQPLTQRASLTKTKSSKIHPIGGALAGIDSTMQQAPQQKLMKCRKNSAAELFQKSKFGKLGQTSCKTTQSEAHMLSFGGHSINDNHSAAEGRSHPGHARSPSKGSNDILRKIIPGQLMPMPLNKSRSSSKQFLSPSRRENLSNSPEKPKQFNIPLQQGKIKTKKRLRESASQQFLLNDRLNVQTPQNQCEFSNGAFKHLQEAINPIKSSTSALVKKESKSNSKIIQISASNKSLDYCKSQYTDTAAAANTTPPPAPSDRRLQQQWSQRQQTWYQEERRIIFSAQSQEQVNQWIKTINNFVQENTKITTVSELISEQFSTFGQSIKKAKKVKKVKKKKSMATTAGLIKARDKQMLTGLKMFNKGHQKRTTTSGNAISNINRIVLPGTIMGGGLPQHRFQDTD